MLIIRVFVTLIVIVSGSLFYIFDIGWGARDGWLLLSGPVFFLAFAAASLWYYQHRQIDLFTLAATLLGGIVVITATLGRNLSWSGPESALVLAVLVILQTGGAAYWIRQVAERSREA